jgi:hypothetical protein
LGDPALYEAPDGRERAERLSRDLASSKAELAGALKRWEEAMAAADAI